jgi:site-specific DNA-methyltransferase (adenine-specific)
MTGQALLLPLPIAAANDDAPTLRADLHQWFTPRFACAEILARHFPELRRGHRVLEPSCGDGRFLLEVPEDVEAVGVEIDPALAERARVATGRQVIAGDFLEVPIDGRFTHAVGNPPFEARTIHRFLGRTYELLEDGGKCGLLLPAYVLQTSTKVLQLAKSWSISQELVPRNLFPRLSLPLVFAMFRKEPTRTLVGFFLYHEAADVSALPPAIAAALREPGKGSIWRRAVRRAFDCLGVQRTHLDALYAVVERPSENKFWREKVRQTLQLYPEFQSEGAGEWTLQLEAQ